jgi:L-seryl-tRNA(Ser) seleniumtransferase
MMAVQASQLFRKLPQAGQLLERAEFVALERTYSRKLVVEHLRSALDDLRRDLKAGLYTEETLEAKLGELGPTVEQRLRNALRPSLRPVINATGVILQTNLGRAPLSESAIQRISEIARGYCNLEFDLQSGERSYRDMHVAQLILDVLSSRAGASKEAFADKAATVVNNCAAACFLALNSLAEGGEVIVSRGELIEIGGGFRVPDILRKSGAVLREVGTTNRTRLSDYEAAITPETRLILRVHRSNFRMEGFTERPELEELRDLGRRASIPVFEDQGSGAVVDVSELGIDSESSFTRSVISGIALAACSGDKLLGGPQCGIVVGAKPYIERIRKNPLFRAMRVDKLTYAALEATLLTYLSGAEDGLPAIRMMRAPSEGIRERCAAMAGALRPSGIYADVVETRSVVGGGTTPGISLPSFAVSLSHPCVPEAAFAARLRNLDPPVVARTNEGRVLLDLRTVSPGDDLELARLLNEAIGDAAGIHDAEEQS